MDQIKVPFTSEQVENLNEYQNIGMFHPFTCANDGDDEHIKYEFEKRHGSANYKDYIIAEKLKGVNYPEMIFTQTNLIATKDGWRCPVCDYKQNWAHSFMAEKQNKI